MDNEMFRRLVAVLKENPDALHAFFCEDCDHPKLGELLDSDARRFVQAMTPKTRLDLALMKDLKDQAARNDLVAACVDSCEASQAGFRHAGDAFEQRGHSCPDVTCACTGATCPGSTCSVTSGQLQSGTERLETRFQSGGCGPDTTCSCTTGTCGGVTCGGSTCSATCTGDSCGNTCGDSCGYTTNLHASRFDAFGFPGAFQRWR